MGEFDFDFDDSVVNKDLYDEPSVGYTIVSWLGKGEEGSFIVDAENIDGDPTPFWELTEHRFGTDPNAVPKQVYMTKRLRCVVIGVRERDVIVEQTGTGLYQEHYFKKGGAYGTTIPGKYRSNVQVMVLVDGVADPVVLGLKGPSKTIPWTNPASGRGHKSEYPVGVAARMEEYTVRAQAQTGKQFTSLCSWVIDLVPTHQEGQPYFINVGQGTHMNPFQIDMRCGDKGLPDTRWVGQEAYEINQGLREELAIPWENEWKDLEYVAPDDDGPSQPEEDDDIPF